MPSRGTGRLALRASWRVGCGDADRAGQAAALDLDRLRGVGGTRCRSTWTGLSGGGSRGDRGRGRAAGTSRRSRVTSLVQARVRAWPHPLARLSGPEQKQEHGHQHRVDDQIPIHAATFARTGARGDDLPRSARSPGRVRPGRYLLADHCRGCLLEGRTGVLAFSIGFGIGDEAGRGRGASRSPRPAAG